MIVAAYRAGDAGRHPGWRMQFGGEGFGQERIDAIKVAIPSTLRLYDPAAQEWWFAIETEDQLERVLPEFGAYRHQLPLF